MSKLPPLPRISPEKLNRKLPKITLGSIFTWVKKLIDWFLNKIYSPKHIAADIRSKIFRWSFAGIWVFLAYSISPEQFWGLLLAIPNAFLNGDPAALSNAGIKLLFAFFFHPVVVRHLLAMAVPFWLMHRIAAIYQADVFEKDEQVARDFIWQAAFGGRYNIIRISQGKVAADDLSSPLIEIGGPGKVIVELDSAALFERPDGSTHILGPSTDAHGGTVIEGFERLRQGFDLRDVIDKQDVTTRSRDGILVTAKDIQYSYCLYRGPNPEKSLKLPYPYDEGALCSLVYDATRLVKLDAPPSPDHDWQSPMPGKIAGQIIGEMGGFINKHGLGEFLATIGLPEEKNLVEREKGITERSQTISGLEKEGPKEAPLKGEEFFPRSMLTKMFHDSFQAKAPNRGSFLNWIGVGTWETGTQIILDNHREAWKQSRENFARGNPEALKRLRDEAKSRELLRLIQVVPINNFYHESKELQDDTLVTNLLCEYLRNLESACEIYRDRGEAIPAEISGAIQEIDRLLTLPAHYVGA